MPRRRKYPRSWSVLGGWTAERITLPPGPLFCVIDGPTRGRAWSDSAVRADLRRLTVCDHKAPMMHATAGLEL